MSALAGSPAAQPAAVPAGGRPDRWAAAALVVAAMLGGAAVPAGRAIGSPAQAPAARESAAELARQLQAHYDAVRDFSADFTHTYEGGVLRKKTTERGAVVIKKPGKMRWTYTSPDEKLFVSDGVKMYAWIPADRQVTVSTLPAGDEPATPLLFLLGRGNIVRDFEATPATLPDAPPDTYALRLVPRRRVTEYDSLIVAVDRATMRLRVLVAHDAQGGTSTFTFSGLKENVGAPDSKFTFTIPRGAEVVQAS